MRLLRPVSAMLLAVGVATCSDTPIASVKSSSAPANLTRLGHVALVPVFSRTAQFVAEHADQFGVTFDSVRIIIRGLPDTLTIVKDTTIRFTPNSPDVVLDLDVAVRSDGQRFDAGMAFTFGGVIQYYGHGEVQSHAPNQPPPPMPNLTINYTGPGSKIARLAVAPKTVLLSGVQSSQLSVTAFDSSGAGVTSPPILWSSSNATVATVSSVGLVQGLNRRGTATITAQSPTGISDAASVSVILPAASISLVSGGGQSGKAGSALANPAVVQVSASDGVGVAGVSVVFSAPSGGAVGTASATTDANGRAQTTMRLGGAAGAQSFAATAAGFSVAIPETATPGDPSAIAIVAGNNQTDSVRKTLAPVSVRVTDQFNNVVNGATVSWARTSGGGSLASATSVTNADGIATNTYTLGSTAGGETVSASITGASVAFSFTATAGGAANIAVVSGGGQTGRVGIALANPFVVRVTDVGGNPVSGAAVNWSATNGTIAATTTTDATGQASATLTPGASLGAASATARIANGQSVSFNATVQAGFVSQMAFTTQPSNGTSGSPLSPAITVALRDAGGNATAAINAVTIALGTNPNGAVLTGTLTRSAVNGVATFNDLQLDRAGTGYTLVATSGSLPSITSAAFNTTSGAPAGPASIAMTGAPTSNPMAQVPFGAITITARDAQGNTLTSESGNVTLSTTGCASCLQGTLTKAFVSGVATFSGVSFTTAGSNISLVATYAGGSPNVTSSPFTVDGAPIITAVPSTFNVAPGGSASPSPKVHVTKTDGITPLTGKSVTFAPANGGGAITKGAASSIAFPSSISFATDVNGDAVLDSWVSPAGVTSGSVTLGANITGTSLSTTFTMNISNGNLTVDNLLIAGVPSSKANNATFTPAVQLRSGTTNVPLSGVTVSATIVDPSTGPNASLPTLVQGTSTTVTATTDATGLATFSNIRAVGAIGSFALHFATTSLTSNVAVTTSDIALFAGAGYGIVMHSGDGQIGLISAALPTGLRVQLVDTSGNPTTAPSATVNFSILTGGGSVSPSAGTDVNGQATATWTLGAAEGSNTMRASTTIGSHTSNVDFGATGSDVHGMQFVATPPSSITTGVVFTPQPIVQLTDGNNHALRKSGVAVTAGVIQAFLQDVIGPHLNGTLTVNTDANGQAIFTNLQDASQTQTVKLTFASAGLTTLQTGAITLVPGSAAQLIQYSGTTLAQLVGGTFTFFPIIKVGDIAGNGVSGKSVSFVATSNCTVTGSAITSDASGFASLDNTTLTVNMAAPGSCKITASSSGLGSKDFYMIVKPSGANVWVGGNDNSFENYQNWTAGAVPTASDAVFIPKYTANTPVIGSAEGVATLSMETGSAMAVSGATTLSVTNSADLSGAAITGGTVNLLGGPSAGNFVRGAFPTLTFGDGTSSCTYGLNGNISTTGSVSIANCNVNNLGKFFTIGADLSITGANGALEMTNSGDHVIVNGNATFDGSTTLGNMTEGVLDLKGNLTQGNTQGSNRSFAPTANHTTRMIGTGQQTITFASPGASNSFFNILDILNTSVSGVGFNSNTQFNGQVDAEGSASVAFGGSSFTFTFGNSALFRIHAFALINANGTITLGSAGCQKNGPTNQPTIGGFSGASVALLQACTQTSLP